MRIVAPAAALRLSHVANAQESFYFRNHLCITFDLLSVNLYEFIKANNFQVRRPHPGQC